MMKFSEQPVWLEETCERRT